MPNAMLDGVAVDCCDAGMNDPHVKTDVRAREDLFDRDRSWQDLKAPRRQLLGPRPRFLTDRTEYAELSALTFDNEGGVATAVQLRKRERWQAMPETQGKPRTVQGKKVIETGSEKPASLRGASEHAKPIWTRSAHLPIQANGNPQCAASNRPNTRKRLTPLLELDKKKEASTHEGHDE